MFDIPRSLSPRSSPPSASLHPYVSMMVGRSMSHVWLRMSDDFWLHLRPSVKFRACHVAPRVMHRPPTPDTKFRHLYMIDIRLIAVDRLRVPRFGHRPGSFSPSFSLPLPFPLSPSLPPSPSPFYFFFFCTKLPVISDISISSLPRVCWGRGPTRTLSRRESRRHHIALIPRHLSYPVPLLSASPQGFCASPRNVIFPLAESCPGYQSSQKQ